MAYDVDTKLKAVQYAEMHNNTRAANHFGVNEKNIRDWRKQKDTLMQMPKTKKGKKRWCCSLS